jgi:hypothetical protein
LQPLVTSYFAISPVSVRWYIRLLKSRGIYILGVATYVDALFSINFLNGTEYCPAVSQTCSITDRTLNVTELLSD